MRLLYQDESVSITQKGAVLKVKNNGVCKDLRLPLGFFSALGIRLTLVSRLFRLSISQLIPISDGFYIILQRKIFIFEFGRFRKIHRFNNGRCLRACVDPFGNLYYGEYFSNNDRVPVNIFKYSRDDDSWSVVYTFRGIRHVHGIFYDSVTDGFFITTGDNDDESGIYRTDKEFSNITIVKEGSQNFRAVDLVIDEDQIIFGSDSPRQTNAIFSLCRRTGTINKLVDVKGSVFFGARYRAGVVFTTCVEPSDFNVERRAEVWWSRDGIAFTCVWSGLKDWLPMKLFQYGVIHLPAGKGLTDQISISPQGLKGITGNALVIKV